MRTGEGCAEVQDEEPTEQNAERWEVKSPHTEDTSLMRDKKLGSQKLRNDRPPCLQLEERMVTYQAMVTVTADFSLQS